MNPSAEAADAERQRQVASALIGLIEELQRELHPHVRRAEPVRLDDDLDQDLGFDSLSRAELVLRVDRQLKVRLPDHLIADARTPGDLLAAIIAARPPQLPDAGGRERSAGALAEVVEPVAAATLIEAFSAHVHAHPERPHILLWQSAGPPQPLTYGELDHAARHVAGGLIDKGLAPGERVALMLPTSREFFEAYCGILYAGGVPVPLYPPFRRAQVEDHLRRQAGILRNAEAGFLIVADEIKPVGSLLLGLVRPLRHVLTLGEACGTDAVVAALPARAETMALIQYTSGSTGDPKGVVLTHANLLANIRAMGQAIEASSATDRFVSWLPLYHDMGLIGAWLACLYYGVPTLIMPPLAFLAEPLRWLRAVTEHRATLTAAPNFAYELCLKSIRDEELASLDLSSLRMCMNGAEPVNPSTIRRFSERFARCGFRPEAMSPVYGLAEDSVGVAFPPMRRGPVIDRIEREAFSLRHVAVPAADDDAAALEFVACGRPLPRHQVRIIDEAGRELPERREGRLQFRGPSATKGYFHNPERTAALLDGDWIDSGDRAYIAGGDIYVTGRIKDMIIRAGRNIYPHELEDVVGGIDGVRKGGVAAFAATDARGGTEKLVVMAETRLTDPGKRETLRARIIEASQRLLDLPPDDIALVPPRTVPKTSSGKVRRSAAREVYESGVDGRESSALWWQLLRLELAGAGNRLAHLGRRLAEELYAGWWWGLLVGLGAILWLSMLMLPVRGWRHAAIGGLARSFFRLTGCRFTVEGGARLPLRDVILVSNHASYLDGLVLSAAIPGEIAFVAKQELESQYVAGPMLRRLGTRFVRRSDVGGGLEDTELTLVAARAGERLVFFPEGTLARMPGVLGFRAGAFVVAARTGRPVVPITISGTRSVLRGEQWFPRRGAITVHIGAPLQPDGSDFAAAIRLRDAARAAILARCGEPDLADERVR
jgi:1-acyl-sn-glycerol-3-phosphate acyltransferase